AGSDACWGVVDACADVVLFSSSVTWCAPGAPKDPPHTCGAFVAVQSSSARRLRRKSSVLVRGKGERRWAPGGRGVLPAAARHNPRFAVAACTLSASKVCGVLE